MSPETTAGTPPGTGEEAATENRSGRVVGRDDHPAGRCGCGHAGETAGAAPVLDVRAVPHAIRHAAVFGALDAVPAGGSLVLLAPHDPLPLLGQLEARAPATFAVAYEERGPQIWQLRLTRER